MKKISQANVLAKECMVTALMQLVDKKPLSSISISEITERAGVSRMTYYRNYSSKEEIFETHMAEIVDSYKNDIAKMEKQEGYGRYRNILHCFTYFERYKDFIRCLLKVGMGGLLLGALSNYMIETYYIDGDNQELYYALQAYAGSLFNVYVAWLNKAAGEPAENMAGIIYKIYREGDTAIRE